MRKLLLMLATICWLTPSFSQLSLLSDEFDHPASIEEWNIHTSGPSADNYYETLEIDGSLVAGAPAGGSDGALTLIPGPGHSGWYQNQMGPMLYKLVTGDFIVSTQVRITNKHDADALPTSDFNAAGLIARNPDTEGNENYLVVNFGMQSAANGIGTENKTTVNGVSTLILSPDDASGEVRICRMGSTFRLYKKTASDEAFVLLNTFDRPDLPATLQVGIMANGWDPAGANPPDIRAEFDYVRFGDVEDESDCIAPLPLSECCYWREGGAGIFTNYQTGIRRVPETDLDILGRTRIMPSPGDNRALTLHTAQEAGVNFNPFVNRGGHFYLDINPYTTVETANATFRFFRRTNTTGSKRVDFLRGTNTTSVDSRISVDGGNSFFNRYGGNVGFGVSNPTAKVHIKGGLRLQSSNNETYRIAVENDGDLKFFGDTGLAIALTDENGYLGVGTANPQTAVDIRGWLTVGNEGDNSQIILNANNGKSAAIGVQDDGDHGFYIRTGGEYRMRVNQNGLVTIGNTASIGGGYKLAVDGKIRTREVRVTNAGWADFVFAEGYALKPLEEVEQFIQNNGHLPDVPSEAEVLEHGTDLGEMDAILLQKVEELTLYMIQLKKENEALRAEVDALKK